MLSMLRSYRFYLDLSLFFVAENCHREKVRWLRMLPYVFNDDINVPNIVTDDESRNVIFEYLYKELTRREQSKENNKHIIVFFIDEYGFSKHPISKFVNSAQSLNVNFVFFNNDASKIASGCGYVIKTNNQSGIIVNVELQWFKQ